MKPMAMVLLSTSLLTPVVVQGEEAAPATSNDGATVSSETIAQSGAAPDASAPSADAAPADEGAAPADAAGSDLAIQEITVTARKRKESAQTVPVSVTALSGELLERSEVKDIADVDSFAPNVQIAPVTVNPGAVVAFIRGVGNRAQSPQVDSPVAISVDGVYLTQVSGGLVDVFDMQGVEVLRGPQGTLQGRNSPGGAINLTTRRPGDAFGVQGEMGMGRFGQRSTRFAVEGPLSGDKLSARLSVGTDNFDGQVWDPTVGQHLGGHETMTFRTGLLFKPTENLKAYFTADYTNLEFEQAGLRYMGTDESYPRQPSPLACTAFGFCTPDDRYTTHTEFNRNSKVRQGGLSSTIDWTLGGVNLTSVTGYREINDVSNVDIDATSLSILNAVDRDLYVKQITQELRLSSERGGGFDFGGNLDWVAGLYYVNGYYNQVQPITLDQFGVATTLLQNQDLDSYAAFAHGIYKITDRWSVSLGGRESYDKKKSDGVAPGFTEADRDFIKGHWSNFSFEGGTEFRVTPDHLLYARYAQGYRAGGIDEINTPGEKHKFKPETVDTYEIGAKTEWFERRLLLNLSLFWSDYKDLQRDVVRPVTNGGVAQGIENAATATIKGVEFESTFRAARTVTLRSTLAYLDASYDKFVADIGTGTVEDNSDLHLPFTPKFTGMLAMDWDVPVGDMGVVTFTPDVRYQSKSNLTPLDVHVSQQSGYALANASATFNADSTKVDWGFGLYVRNIFDQHYIEGAEPTGGVTAWQLEGLRRNWGARVFFKF